MIDRCLLCKEIQETRYIDLYIIGSEGLNVCHTCEMEIVSAIKAIANQKGHERAAEYYRTSRSNSEKQGNHDDA